MVAKDKQSPVQVMPNQELIEAARKAAIRIAERAPKADRERKVPVENIRDLPET